MFSSDPGIPGPIYGSVLCNSLQHLFDTNRTIQDNVAMPVTNPSDQFENICKWPILKPMQVVL